MSSVPSRAVRTTGAAPTTDDEMQRCESTAAHTAPTAPSQPERSTDPAIARASSRALHPSATGPAAAPLEVSPLDTAVLDDIAAGLAAVAAPTGRPEPWEVHTTLLLATAAYDAYLMEWGPAAMSDSHDHDGSVGVVHVVAGSLIESSQRIDADLPDPVRRLEAGDATHISAAQFHRLFNQTGERAVTINVFSPPIGEH